MNHNSAIGIFDSGIGGLTVARAVKNTLPYESIIYFGDTAHLPYGDKSTAAIQAYSIKICNFLIEQKCKIILIACNSASAAAYELIQEYVYGKIEVVNVIDPMVEYINSKPSKNRIGLIGTRQTVESGVYESKFKNLGIDIKSLATPLLVPMIEEGFAYKKISQEIISAYLNNDLLKDIDKLLLACTHYPLIQTEIEAFYENKVEVINSADIVADYLLKVLRKQNLLANGEAINDKFFVSDYTESFEKSTKLFFGEKISLKQQSLF